MTARRRETSDEDLARAAGRGDMAAFQALVGRHQQRIYSLALRLARDRAEAQDMAQEAFLRVYHGLGSFRGESRFSTWMVRVALNTFNRHMRRLRRAGPLPAGELVEEAGTGLPEASAAVAREGNPEALAASREEAAHVRRLVASLPSRFRDAVTMFYLNERSAEEAAEALGISLGTLKSRLFRARELLLRRWQGSTSTHTERPERRERAGTAASARTDGSTSHQRCTP